MTVDLQALLTVLVLIVSLIGAGVAGFLRIKKWVRDVARSSEKTERQLKTSNGKTVADYVEGTAKDLGRINGHIEDLSKATEENRETSLAALTLARNLNERFDSHLINDHGSKPPEPD